LENIAAAERVMQRFGVIDNSVRNFSSLPLDIGQRWEFFIHEHIELVIVSLKGLEHQIEGLMNVTVDVSHIARLYLIHAMLNGSV
jgi:hypothetical protein